MVKNEFEVKNPSKAPMLCMFKSLPKFIGGIQNLCRYFNHLATDVGIFSGVGYQIGLYPEFLFHAVSCFGL